MATNSTSPVAEKEARPAAVPQPAAAPGVVTERLVSLDAFRGFIMFWIIGGEALAVGFQALGRNSLLDALVYELRHTPWQGLRFYDCIWPCFMLMAGVSVPLSYARRSLTHAQLTRHAFERAALLFLLGSVRESALIGSPFLIELSSALQPIAIAYLVAFLLVRKSPRFQAAVGALILAGYALLLAFVPASGIPAGTYQYDHNLVNAVDLALLRDHWLRWPYAVEGWGTVLSTIPTLSTTILGSLVGRWLISERSKENKLKMIGGAGLLCLAVGYALSPLVPIVMKMWTTSYGLVTAGWACLMFLLFYWAVDVRGYRKWAFPFVVIGSNAIFIYMFTSLVSVGNWVRPFTQLIASSRLEPLLRAVAVLGVEWAILYWMYKRKIFIKA